MAVTTWTLTGDVTSLVGDAWPTTGTAAAEAYLTASDADGPVSHYVDAGTAVLFGPTIPVTIAADGSFSEAGIPDSSETGLSYTFTLSYRPTGHGRKKVVTTDAFTVNASGRLDQMPFVNPDFSSAQLLANATDAVVSGIVADESSLTNVALEAEIAEALAFTPTGTITATNVQAAILEVATDSLSFATGAVNAANATAYVPANPCARLTTPDGSSDVTHPSVVDMGEGNTWNGHRYWLAITPMPGSDSQYENPCIYYSDDGDTWTVPAGLTNPIEAYPGGSDYNSDAHLVYDAGTMRCFFRQQIGSTNYYYVRSSTDGVVWGSKTQVYTSALASEAYYSACFTKDADGLWHMHAVNNVPSPNTIEHRTASTYTGTWSAAEVLSVSLPTGREAWHLDIHPFGDRWHGILMDCDTASSGGAGDVYFIALESGATTFTRSDRLVPRRGPYWDRMYRSCMAPSVRNGAFAYDAWWATFGATNRNIAKGAIEFTPGVEPELIRHARDMAAARVPVDPWLIGDTFGRSDASSLGDADSGQTWTVVTGVPGIASGRAYATTAANTIATIDPGTPNYYAEVTIPVLTSAHAAWLIFRRVDNTNFWRFGSNSGTLTLQKDVAATITSYTSPAGNNFAAGITDTEPRVRIGVLVNGSTIQPYVNGIPWGSPLTDSAHSTAQPVGIQASTTAARFDDFMVRRILP